MHFGPIRAQFKLDLVAKFGGGGEVLSLFHRVRYGSRYSIIPYRSATDMGPGTGSAILDAIHYFQIT